MLDAAAIRRFIDDGYVRIDGAFSRQLADECRAILWRDTGCDRNDPRTWTRPVIRLYDYAQPPFAAAANAPALHTAFDQLIGVGRWKSRGSLGTVPVRFPHSDEPGDTGWHVDASYADGDEWRINVFSRERALLMLFLFSDVGADDAPTRIRVGSHLDVARILEPAGAAGLTFMQLAERLQPTERLPLALATGAAGTVYLCHPFLVHAAQRHRGRTPRFMAQPPLYSAARFELDRADGAYSPVEIAIRRGLGRSA
jgi:hypothetical protein